MCVSGTKRMQEVRTQIYIYIEGGKYKFCTNCNTMFGPFKTICHEHYDPETVLIKYSGPNKANETKHTLSKLILSLSTEQITI